MRYAIGNPKKICSVLWRSLFVLILVGLFQVPVFAQGGRRYDGWHPMMGGWGMGGFGWIFTILFWGFAIALIVYLVRLLFRNTGGEGDKTRTRSGALDILDERYARGEIDKSQYEAMKRDILAR